MNLMTIQNPRLDIESLVSLEHKIKSNNATPDDYETLDYFISNLGVQDYILNKLKKHGIDSYDMYILKRKDSNDSISISANGILLGTILGAITVLKDYLSKKR